MYITQKNEKIPTLKFAKISSILVTIRSNYSYCFILFKLSDIISFDIPNIGEEWDSYYFNFENRKLIPREVK